MAARLNVAVEPNAGLPFHVVLRSIALRSRKDAVLDFPHQAGHYRALSLLLLIGLRSLAALDTKLPEGHCLLMAGSRWGHQGALVDVFDLEFEELWEALQTRLNSSTPVLRISNTGAS